MAKGLAIDEAVAISKKQVADELGGLPPAKMHCSVLATDGLKVAVDDYLKKHGREPIAGEIKSSDPNFDPHSDEDHDHGEHADHEHDTAGPDGECSVCCQQL